MERRIASYLPSEDRRSARVLEVGCGPVGIVSFMDWGVRYGLDSLETYYRTNPSLVEERHTSVQYIPSAAESLPFPDSIFTLVILDNVLDHTKQPQAVLLEISRVLQPSGILYMALNVRTRWGALIHKLLATLRIDRGHPYSFTIHTARFALKQQGYTILSDSTDDYHAGRSHDIRSSSITDKIKGFLGISEFLYYAVSTKTSPKK